MKLALHCWPKLKTFAIAFFFFCMAFYLLIKECFRANSSIGHQQAGYGICKPSFVFYIKDMIKKFSLTRKMFVLRK
jgi:hypothetical protein